MVDVEVNQIILTLRPKKKIMQQTTTSELFSMVQFKTEPGSIFESFFSFGTLSLKN